MNAWPIGIGCLAVGLYGAYTARDASLRNRRGIAFLGWIPFALWIAFTLSNAWRNP